MLKSSRYMIANVPAIDIGSARLGMTVAEIFRRNKKITRTFEMESAPFGVQLEFLEFESLTNDTSKLTMHVVYRSVDIRDQILKLPFAQGINMAHNRLQEIVNKLK